MCDTLVREHHGDQSMAHMNFQSRICNFMEAVRAIDDTIKPISFKKGSNCNQIFHKAYEWEKSILNTNKFGSSLETRQRHLCDRVASKHYDKGRFPGNLCGNSNCHGVCNDCDEVAIKMIS